MQDVTQLQQSAIDRVQLLTTDRLIQVIDFIDFLLERTESSRIAESGTPQGSTKDLLAASRECACCSVNSSPASCMISCKTSSSHG